MINPNQPKGISTVIWQKVLMLVIHLMKIPIYIAYNDYFVLQTMGELYSAYGNPNLNAEKGKNYEFGINHKFDDNNIISSHVFYRNSDRIIGYDYSQKRYANINQKIKAHGFDV